MEAVEESASIARIDTRRVRVNHAVAMIAYYVRTGGGNKWSAFIPPLWDCPIFNHWFNDPQYELVDCGFVRGCLDTWPKEKEAYFHAYALVRLMRRHTPQDQYQIISGLRMYHGFNFKF